MDQRPMYYPACPECKKKVMSQGAMVGGRGEMWTCEKCNKTYNECNYTYNFSTRLGDLSDHMYANVLGEVQGDELVGMKAKELKDMIDSDPNQIINQETGNPSSEVARDYIESR